MSKRILTEEERKAAKREYDRRRYQANKEKIAEYHTEYYKTNKEKFAEYYQANKEKKLERQAEYYQTNKEKITEHNAEYRKANREKILAQKAEYYATPIGRATYLLNAYKTRDKKYNRGECTLTAKWIVDNIFSKPCHYCGEPDWTKLGCDRIDNDKPHTPDNVVPCCYHCNCKKHTMEYNEFINKKRTNSSPS